MEVKVRACTMIAFLSVITEMWLLARTLIYCVIHASIAFIWKYISYCLKPNHSTLFSRFPFITIEEMEAVSALANVPWALEVYYYKG